MAPREGDGAALARGLCGAALHPRGGPPCAWARGRLEPQEASSAATQTTSLRPCWSHAPPPPRRTTHSSGFRFPERENRDVADASRPSDRHAAPTPRRRTSRLSYTTRCKKKGSGDSRVRAYDTEEPVITGPPPRASAKPPLPSRRSGCALPVPPQHVVAAARGCAPARRRSVLALIWLV